jgi:glycosyltransferase 2 family protein
MPAMRSGWRSAWRWLKALLAVAIVAGVGWQFARLLAQPELWDRPWQLHPGWLAVSVLTYVVGLGCWGTFWLRLLHRLGLHPPAAAAYRAYYVSHLGKYVPGKAWAILLRATLLPGVRPAIAALTATYETLTTMAAGALLAVCLIPWLLAGQEGLGWQALGLLALAGVPILPGVFNAVIVRVARPFLDPAVPPPRVPAAALPEGIIISGCGWVWLGVSVLALLQALVPDAPAPSLSFVLRCVAFNALSYVAGFLTLPAPGGLGVREVILQQLLAAELRGVHSDAVAAGLAALAVVVLRLVWTATDLAVAAIAAGGGRLIRGADGR